MFAPSRPFEEAGGEMIDKKDADSRFSSGIKSEVAARTRDRDRDSKRRSTYDDNKAKQTSQKGDPHRHKGYEDPKATGKDMVVEVLDEALNEGWM